MTGVSEVVEDMAPAQPAGSMILHASCVALEGRGVLILGPSGAGKSALALSMIAAGCLLVADDRTRITRAADGRLMARPPAAPGLIEARGIGILRAPHVASASLVLAVDLARQETERLPPRRLMTLLGRPLPLVLGAGNAHLVAPLVVYLKGGPQEPLP